MSRCGSIPVSGEAYGGPSPEKVTVYLEMFRLVCICCAKPHQIIALGFVKLLEWRPREAVDELSDQKLGILAEKLFDQYVLRFMGVFDRDRLNESFSDLFDKMDRPPGACYGEDEYVSKIKGFERVGEITLRVFYGANPAQSLSDWCDKVKNRARKAVMEGRLCRTIDS